MYELCGVHHMGVPSARASLRRPAILAKFLCIRSVDASLGNAMFTSALNAFSIICTPSSLRTANNLPDQPGSYVLVNFVEASLDTFYRILRIN